MKPLKPEDLLIRTTPVEHERWTDKAFGGVPDASAAPIRLERHQELEQILRNNPIEPTPYVELARIYLNQERWQEAKRVLDRAADQFSKEESVLALREDAQVARSLQLMAAAEKEYREEPTILTEQAFERARTELCAMREKVCRARLARHPDRLELTIPLADALDGLDRAEEAFDYLRKAADIPELRASASFKLGELLEKQNRVTEALSAYRRAALFRVPPPSEEIRIGALAKAAELARAHDMFDSAARYVQMLRTVDPKNPRWQLMAEEISKAESSISASTSA